MACILLLPNTTRTGSVVRHHATQNHLRFCSETPDQQTACGVISVKEQSTPPAKLECLDTHNRCLPAIECTPCMYTLGGVTLSTVSSTSTVPAQVLDHDAHQCHQRVRLELGERRRAQCIHIQHDETAPFKQCRSVIVTFRGGGKRYQEAADRQGKARPFGVRGCIRRSCRGGRGQNQMSHLISKG